MWRALILTVLVLTANSAAVAEESPKEILERAIQAHGGKEKLARHDAVRTTTEGTTRFNGLDIRFTSEAAAQLPDRMRNELTLELGPLTVRSVQVLQGDAAWVRVDDETREIQGNRLAELKDSLYAASVESLTPLLDGEKVKLTPLAERKMGDRAAVGFRVASLGHADIDLYFDRKSGLLILSRRLSLDATGREVMLETTYEDYKTFDGLRVATHLILKHDGKQVMDGRVRNIRFLDSIPASEFTRP